LIEVWLEIGLSLYQNTPESTKLACDFFTVTPELLQSLNLARIERLALFLNRLAVTSDELAAECLNAALEVLAKIGRKERGRFLSLALFLAKTTPEESASYFTRGAEVLARVDKRQQKPFLTLTEKMARTSARRALTFFFDCSQAIQGIDGSLHSRLLNWSETLLAISIPATIEFLKSCPNLLAKFQISGLERWFEEGVALLRQDQSAGLAHFRSESVAEETLEWLKARVDLEQVDRVLLMYAQALAGGKVQIRSNEGLKEWGLGWIPPDRPTTDGTTIFVPSSMDRYHSEEKNFAWYKVATTHQAGHIEFGTFDYSFERPAVLFPNRRWQLPATDGVGFTDIERFFDLFEDRKLAADIFTVTEDTRIDYLLKQEYAGIRSSYEHIQQDSLSRRPALFSLPLREAFLESLIQVSLDGVSPVIPLVLRGQFQSAVSILRCVQSPAATVEDSTEATLRLYDIISVIPNTGLPAERWDLAGAHEMGLVADHPPVRENGEDITPEPNTEFPYRDATEVDFRGSFNPELVQLLLKMKEDPHPSKPSDTPLSPELLKQLAGKEIKLDEVLRGEHPSSGLYTTDLPTGAKTQESVADKRDSKSKLVTVSPAGETLGGEEEQFFYDEWDFQACCYLPRWCRVREKPPVEGSADFFKETLASNSLLVAQIRKQFEMLSPEFFKKLTRLHDGDGLDLNAVIDAVVERKAGRTPSEKVYWKKRRLQRDVAAIFLLDMSSSTASPVEDADEEADEGYFDWYFERMGAVSWLKAYRTEGLTKTPRRVIDVTKDRVVLMISALETIGDCYGIYGFSGHGRENVELLVIKAMDEKFSDTVERRIDGIRPMRSTRMGPAIRHVSSKLEAREAKTKILFLVSDGYPQDKGYGRDSNDKEYALHDTRMALIEAKRKNIIPFCLTIDIAGYDYLEKMSAGFGYEVISNVESLPQRLPVLYRRLTS